MANGRIVQKRNKFTVEVEVFLLKEGKQYVSYCPALELTGYGSDPRKAESSFGKMLKIFIAETDRLGRLERELLNLGWTLRKLPSPQYEPPRIPISNTLLGSERVIEKQISLPL